MPKWQYPKDQSPIDPPPGWEGGTVEWIMPVDSDLREPARIWRHTADDPIVEVYYTPGSREVVYRESHPMGWDPVRVEKARTNTAGEKVRVARGFMNSFNSVQQSLRDPGDEFDFAPDDTWYGGGGGFL